MDCCNQNCNQGRNCPARAAKWALIGIAAALSAAAATVLLGVRA